MLPNALGVIGVAVWFAFQAVGTFVALFVGSVIFLSAFDREPMG